MEIQDISSEVKKCILCKGELQSVSHPIYICTSCDLEMELTEHGFWRSPGSSKTDVNYPIEGHSKIAPMEDKSFWFQHRNRIIGSVINRFPPKGPIWDIGGGNGFVSQYLERRGFDTVLLEPGIDGALAAKKRGIKHIINDKFENLKLPEDSIYAVSLFDVLEHINEPVGFLERITAGLKRNGMLYITVPSYNFLWSDSDKDHVKRYTLRILREEAKAAKLSPVYMSYFMAPLILPILIKRRVPYLLGKRKTQNEIINELVMKDDRSTVNRVLARTLSMEEGWISKHRFFCGASAIATFKKP